MKRFAITVIVVLLFVAPAHAQENERADTTFKLGSRWLLELDPNDQPYPDYIADPRRPRMQVGVGVADSDIPESSSTRVMLDLGTRYTLLKIKTDPSGTNEFALDIEGGLFNQFDPGLGLEGYIGRAILGEFALDNDEAYLTAGVFFDFY